MRELCRQTAAVGEQVCTPLWDDRQGTCLDVLNQGAHLGTCSWTKATQTARPQGRGQLQPPKRGPGMTNPCLKCFSIFFPDHSRRSCRYMDLSARAWAHCNLLKCPPSAAAGAAGGLPPGSVLQLLQREPLPGL